MTPVQLAFAAVLRSKTYSFSFAESFSPPFFTSVGLLISKRLASAQSLPSVLKYSLIGSSEADEPLMTTLSCFSSVVRIPL